MSAVPAALGLGAILALGAASAGFLWSLWQAQGKGPVVQDLVDQWSNSFEDLRQLISRLLQEQALADLETQLALTLSREQRIDLEVLRLQLLGITAEETSPGLLEFLSAGGGQSEAEQRAAIAAAAAGAGPGERALERPVEAPGGAVGALSAAALATGIAGAIGAVSTPAWERMGLHQHRGALGSMPSTAAALQGLLRIGLPAVGIAGLLRDPFGGRSFLEGRLGSFLQGMVDPQRFPHPLVGPDGLPLTEAVRDSAARLVMDRMVFGLEAHAASVLGEGFTPLKNMGFSQFAGFLSDLSGFQRVASSLLMPYEFSGINAPLRLDAQRRYRTTLPDVRDIELLYAKKEITPPEMAMAMQLHGWADKWIEVGQAAFFLDPRLTEIVRIGQFFQPSMTPSLREPTPEARRWLLHRFGPFLESSGDVGIRDRLLGPDWWFYYKLAKGGYEPTDVLVLTEVAKRATTRREQTLFLDATTRLYRDGFIDDARLEALVDEAWELSNPKSARIRATQLRTEAEDLGDLKDLVLSAVSRQALTPGEARQTLLDAGMRSTAVDLALLRGRLGLLPRGRLRLPADELEDLGDEEE